MDYRKLTDHLILLLLVAVVSFGIAVLVRLAVLRAGEDVGTANLAFLGTLAACGVLYIFIVSVLANMVIPWVFKKLGFKPRPVEDMAKAEEAPAIAPSPGTSPEPAPIPATTEPRKSADIPQMRKDIAANQKKQKEDNLRLFQDYAHRMVGVYMPDAEIPKLDKAIELSAKGKEVPPELNWLHTTELDNADLFHFGWNMHNFFKVSDQEDAALWLKAVFDNLSELSFSTIKGKLKHNERATYKIPIEENIPGWMASQDS